MQSVRTSCYITHLAGPKMSYMVVTCLNIQDTLTNSEMMKLSRFEQCSESFVWVISFLYSHEKLIKSENVVAARSNLILSHWPGPWNILPV